MRRHQAFRPDPRDAVDEDFEEDDDEIAESDLNKRQKLTHEQQSSGSGASEQDGGMNSDDY